MRSTTVIIVIGVLLVLVGISFNSVGIIGGGLLALVLSFID